MNKLQTNYLEAKKNYLEASDLAWELVDAVLEEKGLDYDREEQTDEIIKVEEACYTNLKVTEKKEIFKAAFIDLKEWGVSVIEKMDTPASKKKIAIDLLRNDKLMGSAESKIENLLLRLSEAL